MLTTEFDLNSFLSDIPLDQYGSFVGPTDDGSVNDVPIDFSTGWKEPGYEGTIDYRIRQLSYSSINLLHTCPRKYELYKRRTTRRDDDFESSVTFAFGHVVGEAIQLAFQGKTRDEVIWNMFLMWKPELFASNDKQAKSFWLAVQALDRFLNSREQGFLDDYELVYYDNKPACELSFVINFPDGFRYRGHVDAVLRNILTGSILVLECKTTGMASVAPATYKNSAQAIGYSIVLDHLFPDLSSYEVLYLIYQTKSKEYLTLPFQKSYLQRAQWIRELLLDIESIKMYEEAEVYPMHGESCRDWNRDCEYFGVCTLNTKFLAKPCTEEQEDRLEYQVEISLDDLLETQLRKAS